MVVFSTEITEQKENWAPEMWVATDELVSIAQTTSKGNPIYFRTDWGVVDGDDDVIETNITSTYGARALCHLNEQEATRQC